MIRKEDPTGSHIKKYNLSKLKALFLAGERSDPTTLEWAHKHLNIDVVDNYWQTETGWPMISNFIHEKGATFSPKFGSATKPVPGYNFSCLDDEGKHVEPNELGNLVVKLPLPPGCFPTLYQNPKKYVSSYFSRFPGFYETSDSGVIDDDGYISIMTRTDDIINVNGVRISTGALEEIILQNKNVAECAVVGIENKFSGQIPIALVVTADTDVVIDHNTLAEQIVQSIRVHFGKFTHLNVEDVISVKLLPKSRSGKVLRNVIRNIANGNPPNPPATIEDLSVVGTLQELFEKVRKSTNKE
jgi:propionyl-CoA synthetase